MSSPSNTLREYMNAMRAWELECAFRQDACERGEMPFKQTVEIGMQQYVPIYDAFVSRSLKPPRDFHFSIPPDYDSSSEVIVSTRVLDERHVEIETKQLSGFEDLYVYSLIFDGNRWLLYEKELITANGDRIKANL